MNAEIIVGLEACISERPACLQSARFGLLMNRASVDRNLRLACDLLGDAYPRQLAALFSPQHGMWGDAQANMIETDHDWHSTLNIPIYSLYSESRRPTVEMLAELDCLVIDLQDVGTRVYTFVWTMLECLKACADAKIAVLVLDRPNPVGGRIVEGPVLREPYRSFVGGAAIPMRHGLTMGELALFLKSEYRIDVVLDVVAMQGWSPERTFVSLDRHWLPPSPNLPRVESASVYPGQVLLEGTNLSEGRGTTIPFEIVGAPFIETEVLIDAVSEFDPPGVRLLPINFRPTFDKWQGKLCRGVSLHVTDAGRYRSVRTSIAILHAVQQHWPSEFRWLDPPYEYETEKYPIDIIYGSSDLRERLGSVESIEELATLDVDAWNQRTADIQIYRTGDQRFQ